MKKLSSDNFRASVTSELQLVSPTKHVVQVMLSSLVLSQYELNCALSLVRSLEVDVPHTLDDHLLCDVLVRRRRPRRAPLAQIRPRLAFRRRRRRAHRHGRQVWRALGDGRAAVLRACRGGAAVGGSARGSRAHRHRCGSLPQVAEVVFGNLLGTLVEEALEGGPLLRLCEVCAVLGLVRRDVLQHRCVRDTTLHRLGLHLRVHRHGRRGGRRRRRHGVRRRRGLRACVEALADVEGAFGDLLLLQLTLQSRLLRRDALPRRCLFGDGGVDDALRDGDLDLHALPHQLQDFVRVAVRVRLHKHLAACGRRARLVAVVGRARPEAGAPLAFARLLLLQPLAPLALLLRPVALLLGGHQLGGRLRHPFALGLRLEATRLFSLGRRRRRRRLRRRLHLLRRTLLLHLRLCPHPLQLGLLRGELCLQRLELRATGGERGCEGLLGVGVDIVRCGGGGGRCPCVAPGQPVVADNLQQRLQRLRACLVRPLQVGEQQELGHERA
eukprot:Rhum_TRINITY_DN14423_c3_g1::Rhum_TRINITY_DN14423_c3_g1_i1::g.88942::m.88942